MTTAEPVALTGLGSVRYTAAQARVITAALELFAEHGVGGTSLGMIAEALEWAQHVAIGRDAGFGDEEIARIAYGADAPFWGELDAALLRSVDELLADGAIGERTWAVLAAELDARQLLDVVFTVGATPRWR